MAQGDTTTHGAGTTTWKHEYWSSRLVFVLAATGSAVGLGNIWKFPYITGVYGGGAFVLVYLVCIALIGLPVMMAEILIGRRGGQSPVGTMRVLARQERKSPLWEVAGWMGVFGSFLILSFYSVIAGWAVVYVWYAASGQFNVAEAAPEQAAAAIGAIFDGLLASPLSLIAWHTVFMAVTIFIVAGGIKAGLERAVTIMMPGLFLILFGLVAYAAFATDGFGRAVVFLFQPDFSKLSWEGVLVALGHAFLSLSLGMGIMIAFGAYLPRHNSIASASITVAFLDTLVALLAGMAIFPLVFSYGLEPGTGPGLVFVTLPITFGEMPAGTLVGTLFFILVVFAALTSSISLLEPTVAFMQERHGIGRWQAAVGAGLVIWLVGIASALSFNVWSGVEVFEKTIFDSLDFLTANIMLPVTALLMALFAGWAMAAASTREELEMGDSSGYRAWRFAIRYISPVCILIIFIYNLL
jgi:NSS family neurotransmitter:Na+ symporter